ncbi:MAG: RluA family pseudouridine synthase [Candidatus Doudnabacteria bacterium]|nr:RluA family pseudouridine synthase [Candidatus Doudnabacteria bacterium]
MLEFISETTNRLDKFIASKVEVSRSKVQKAIKEGKVMVDGIIVLDPDYDVIVGNKVTLAEFESEALKPSDIILKVLFENEDLAVIDKPAGMVVHPGAGNLEDTLANALLTYFPGIEKVGEPHRPGIVHRLDENTSGLILIAKTQTAYEYFKRLFQERKVEKEYLALVHLVPDKKHDVINEPLEKVPLKQKMKVGSGKEAVTEYSVVKEGFIDGLDEVALLKVKLHTGRTHQIRAHLAHIGHPILGDEVYGSNYKQQDVRVINRQFLHAYRLKFQLLDGTWIELVSKLPKELQQVLKKANISYDN